VGKTASIEVSAGRDWLKALLCNDQQGIRLLYRDHFPAVQRYVLDNSGTEDDAQDIFQEAFLVLWLRVKEGRYEAGTTSDPGGFLFQVAKHKWLDVLRSAKHRHMRVLRDEEMHGLVAEPVTSGTEEQLARLRAVYARLDAKCRQVLDLFYFERKDLASIARMLSVEEESIRTIKYRCMMKLRASRASISGENQREA
jgi:RNA polymerase sigma factor (sigma-70 family)